MHYVSALWFWKVFVVFFPNCHWCRCSYFAAAIAVLVTVVVGAIAAGSIGTFTFLQIITLFERGITTNALWYDYDLKVCGNSWLNVGILLAKPKKKNKIGKPNAWVILMHSFVGFYFPFASRPDHKSHKFNSIPIRNILTRGLCMWEFQVGYEYMPRGKAVKNLGENHVALSTLVFRAFSLRFI